MNQQTKNTMLVVAILAGLLSLPTTWMTIRNAQFQGGMGEMFNAAFNNMTIDVTGLNGHVTFLVKTPIWLIVVLAIAASAMQLMQASQVFAVPQSLVWGVAILALLWVVLAIVVALGSGQASLGIGALLGLVAAAIPIATLWSAPTAAPSDQSLQQD